MCGIAGFRINKLAKKEWLVDMVDTLIHRGPDSSGFFTHSNFSGGMRRLSINGIENGAQPLFSSNKNVVVLYNGEIYNYHALRSYLEKKGVKFNTGSDGEVICHLYDFFGEELFSKLEGMYAISLWLVKERRLILARDIPGEKPLYYAELSRNEVIFSSEIKSLTKFPGIDHDINKQAIWDLPTFTWIPQPETIFSSIKSLESGTMLIVDDSGIRRKKIDYSSKINCSFSDEDLIDFTRTIVSKSINDRLISDVPVGCFLSGGVDSSIVAKIASERIKNMNTFTVGFEDTFDPYGHGKSDESHLAIEYSKEIGTKHHTIFASPNSFKEYYYDYIKFCDQPFAVPSGIGIYAISKKAKEIGVKVLLSGDCADECFGGYSWYSHLNSNQQPLKSSNEDITFNSFAIPEKDRLGYLNSLPSHKRALAWHYYASENEKKHLFNREYFGEVSSSDRFFVDFNTSTTWNPETFISQDREFYLKNEMLQKLDRMTMANSVEGRIPFCSQEILQLSSQLKYENMVRDGETKWLLKKAFTGIIPDRILYRKKHGFNIPIDEWLRSSWIDLFEETFSSNSLIFRMGILNDDSIKFSYELLNNQNKQNGPTLFSLITLNLWLENFYGNNS